MFTILRDIYTILYLDLLVDWYKNIDKVTKEGIIVGLGTGLSVALLFFSDSICQLFFFMGGWG